MRVIAKSYVLKEGLQSCYDVESSNSPDFSAKVVKNLEEAQSNVSAF